MYSNKLDNIDEMEKIPRKTKIFQNWFKNKAIIWISCSKSRN